MYSTFTVCVLVISVWYAVAFIVGYGRRMVILGCMLGLWLYIFNLVCDVPTLFSILCHGEEYNYAMPLLEYNISELEAHCNSFLKSGLDSTRTLLYLTPYSWNSEIFAQHGLSLLETLTNIWRTEYAPNAAKLEYLISSGVEFTVEEFRQWKNLLEMEGRLYSLMHKIANRMHPHVIFDVSGTFNTVLLGSRLDHLISVANTCIDASMQDIDISTEIARLKANILSTNRHIVKFDMQHLVRAADVASIAAKQTELNELLVHTPIRERILVFSTT